MVVPRPPTNEAPRMSFKVPFEELNFGHDWQDHYWRIEVPKPRVDELFKLKMPNGTESFVHFRQLSLGRGEVILDRAMRIWKAWHEDEMELPAHKRKVCLFLTLSRCR